MSVRKIKSQYEFGKTMHIAAFFVECFKNCNKRITCIKIIIGQKQWCHWQSNEYFNNELVHLSVGWSSKSYSNQRGHNSFFPPEN